MPRKKIEPIKNLGDTGKLIVQKSLPLFQLWRSDLTLAEFKIMDIYLSRIDSHKPDKRAVLFNKGELEKALGVKKINNQDLKDRLKHLMSSVVQLPDDSKKGFRLVTLFEEAEAEQDDNGLWQVRLECTQKAMMYFFNIENLGYLRYKLRCITALTSRYAYIMFVYIEHNRYRKTWEISLEELKKVLSCEQEEYAKEFRYFNRDVLKRIQAELSKKTECRYTYEPIKKGRSVVAIRFTVEPIRAIEEPIDLPDDAPPESDKDAYITFLLDAVEQGLNRKQMEVVAATIATRDVSAYSDSVDLGRYHYLAKMWAQLKAYDSIKPIKNKYAYFKKMLEADCGQTTEQLTLNTSMPEKEPEPDKKTELDNAFYARQFVAEHKTE